MYNSSNSYIRLKDGVSLSVNSAPKEHEEVRMRDVLLGEARNAQTLVRF